jgi:hypothetical protein
VALRELAAQKSDGLVVRLVWDAGAKPARNFDPLTEARAPHAAT